LGGLEGRQKMSVILSVCPRVVTRVLERGCGGPRICLTPSVCPFVGCLSTYVENGGWVVAQYVQGRWSVSATAAA